MWDQTIGIGLPGYGRIADFAIDLWYRVIVRLFYYFFMIEITWYFC